MPISRNKTKANKVTFLLILLAIITVSWCLSQPVFASENTREVLPPMTVSKGVYKKELNNEIRKKIIQKNKQSNEPDQLNGKATNTTRTLHQEKLRIKSNKKAKSQRYDTEYLPDFSIYGASSLLQDDFDGDGFYQTFSVVFDADIYSYTQNNLGEVYAQLYISQNGGPWTHYYTTDNFIIEGESELDEYEVITTFLSGYSSNYYDVLIDLYQVGYSDVVATYSSDDSNALYGLSLESADYDENYIYEDAYIEVVEIHGGSISYLLLLIIIISFTLRKQDKIF